MTDWTSVCLSSRDDVKDSERRQHLPSQPQCTHLLVVFCIFATGLELITRMCLRFFFPTCKLNKPNEKWWNRHLATCSLQCEGNTKKVSLPSSFSPELNCNSRSSAGATDGFMFYSSHASGGAFAGTHDGAGSLDQVWAKLPFPPSFSPPINQQHRYWIHRISIKLPSNIGFPCMHLVYTVYVAQ